MDFEAIFNLGRFKSSPPSIFGEIFKTRVGFGNFELDKILLVLKSFTENFGVNDFYCPLSSAFRKIQYKRINLIRHIIN